MNDKFKENKTVIIVIIAAFVFAAAILVGFYLSFSGGNDNPITLPDSPTITESSVPGDDNPDDDPFISVQPSNVKDILRTLSRPANYHREINVSTIYSGGSLDTIINIWESDGKVKLVLESDMGVRNVLIKDGELSIWYEGSDEVYRQPYNGTVTVDELQLMLTYEDILDMPDEMITDAKYVTLPSQKDARCIYIEVHPGLEGYVDRYWVSLDSGMLVEAYTLYNSELELCYNMSEVSMELLPANDEKFDGLFEIYTR